MDDFVKVVYSRSQIDKAGKIISKCSEITSENEEYLKIIDNWRAAHAYPLQVISDLIERALFNQTGLLKVHRLKRLESIVGKLQRPNNTGLYRMQDLGGCRVIVPTVIDVYQVVEKIKNQLQLEGHLIKNTYDYIKDPPEHSGYRSYHLVAQYQGENDYNGMYIEIQVRTKLQHTWATAVEIIDCIERNKLLNSNFKEKDGLKAGAGKDSYRYFFKLVSALFSIDEKTTIVAGVPQTKQEIIESIYNIDNVEKIRNKLASYSHAIRITGTRPDEADYYLLLTNIRRSSIKIIPFEQSHLVKATELYEDLEKKYRRDLLDVVLVAAKSFAILKESYSNYFGDAQLFLSSVDELCSDIPEKPNIALDTRSKCKRLVDLYNIKHFSPNIPNGLLVEDGIGVVEGNSYYCYDERMTLQDSYLRFSGIKLDQVEIDKIIKMGCQFTHIKGPGILISRRGGSYYISDEEWNCISSVDYLLIQAKSDNSKEDLLVLISWLKSNVFIWDLLWNKFAHSLHKNGVIESIYIPDLEEDVRTVLVDVTSEILTKEYDFVKMREEKILAGLGDVTDEQLYQFNHGVLDSLKKIESVYKLFFDISNEEQKSMEHELNLKGYFVYG